MKKIKHITSSNKSNIIELIRSNESIFKAEIARLTGLSIPTVMRITDELINDGIVNIAGKGKSSGGKPPELLQIIPNSKYFIGVDIGGEHNKSVILDLKGSVVDRRKEKKSSNDIGYDQIFRRINQIIETIISNSGIPKDSIAGIGVGIPGIVDPKSGCVVSANLQLDNCDLMTPIKNHFSYPVLIDNTAKVMAIGEQWFGNGEVLNDFILLALGPGIGSAIIIDGDIYRGSHNMSGEVGHIIIDSKGPLCKCGVSGCLEALASRTAIRRMAQERLKGVTSSKMIEIANGSLEDIDARIVFQAADSGDKLALEIANQVMDYLCIGIINLVSLFDVEYIIISGEMAKESEFLIRGLNERVRIYKRPYFGNLDIHLEKSSMGEDAAAIGAATLALRSFISTY